MEIWGKTFWHWGATLSVHQEALLSYAEAVPLCVLLLCKYRPSDYTGCWAWDLALRSAERQKHTEFKPSSWGSLVEELSLHMHEEENNVDEMRWSEFQHDVAEHLWLYQGFERLWSCFSCEKGGLGEAACTIMQVKVAVLKFNQVNSESCVWHKEEEPQSRVKKFSVPALD